RELEPHANGLKDDGVPDYFIALRTEVNKLTDVDKHYRRKENLLFPFLEKYEITGPPTVMWGKHDETRELLHATVEGLSDPANVKGEEAASFVQLVIEPAASAIEEMIMKEEEILFPMAMDTLTEADWYEIYRQTPEIGFCLYDPKDKWAPEGITPVAQSQVTDTAVQLPSGILEPAELLAILNTLPADLTFVDRNDKVKYFSQGPHRIFDRNRAILNRDVRLCHPPGSVHIVEQILEDFKSGRQEKARFWIQMKGKFILIEYYALRGEKNEYLGTVEVSQELSEYRALEGEQRLLNYDAG
ncbi:MAG TPA: PAS domain-containing protein, partial [Bacteroidales bacterium]|nr:PAS domain-containing protein [Bacteroidales bacterium]